MSEAPPSPASIQVVHDDDDGDKKKKPPQDPAPTNTAHIEEKPPVSRDTPVMTTLIRYLQQEGWTFLRRDHVVLSHLTGHHGSYRLMVDVRQERDPDQRLVLVYVTAPVKVVPEQRLAVVEYTTRANWVVVVGNFEMDLADGEIRYKGCLEYADGDVTASMLARLIHRCAGTMDQYFAGLMRILYGNVDAVAAIQPIVPQQGSVAWAPLVEAVAVSDTSTTVEKATMVNEIEATSTVE